MKTYQIADIQCGKPVKIGEIKREIDFENDDRAGDQLWEFASDKFPEYSGRAWRTDFIINNFMGMKIAAVRARYFDTTQEPNFVLKTFLMPLRRIEEVCEL